MSQVLTVPTHFNDLGELSEGFVDRVERDTLILYGPVAYEDGSDIEFAVLLADGSPALEGVGRVRAAVDGGAGRVRETRYDIVIEALQLDGHYEVVFERLVLARQSISEGVELAAGDAFSVPPDDVYSLAPEDAAPITVSPEEPAPDTVPPQAFEHEQDQDQDEEDEPETVVAVVDAEAMMAQAAEADEEVRADDEAEGPFTDEPQMALDSDFEQEVAAEPRVGMPVPVPSMAAPPDAPPAPPRLRLAEPPAGLTRPSLSQVEESHFHVDGEISDVHTTGLFAYEDGLPIPSRPPLPDPNRARIAHAVEARGSSDVEEPERHDMDEDEYEEIRLSDFAEEG
jgi:hypothetical protein